MVTVLQLSWRVCPVRVTRVIAIAMLIACKGVYHLMIEFIVLSLIFSCNRTLVFLNQSGSEKNDSDCYSIM